MFGGEEVGLNHIGQTWKIPIIFAVFIEKYEAPKGN
jgi:hypothetical protein